MWKINKKRVINPILFLLILVFLIYALGYVYEIIHQKNINDTIYYPKIRWEDFYNLEENTIDILFLGSSHAYRSFDPEIFYKNLDCNSFNMGSSIQKPDTGYYILNDILRNQKPKLIIYELYWQALAGDYNYRQMKLNFEFMKESINKKKFFNSFKFQDKIKNKIKILKYQKDLNAFINNKITNGVNEYNDEYYKLKGFVYNDNVVSKTALYNNNQFKDYQFTNLSQRQLEYLDRTIELCEQNDITVLFVTAPIPPASIKFIDNYNDIHEKVKEIADSYNIPYLDYNLINKSERMFKNKNFKDDDHLNYSGVKIMNEHLIKYIKDKDLY